MAQFEAITKDKDMSENGKKFVVLKFKKDKPGLRKFAHASMTAAEVKKAASEAEVVTDECTSWSNARRTAEREQRKFETDAGRTIGVATYSAE
jgi:hypothetical protein